MRGFRDYIAVPSCSATLYTGYATTESTTALAHIARVFYFLQSVLRQVLTWAMTQMVRITQTC
jgi:hypothetical protein